MIPNLYCGVPWRPTHTSDLYHSSILELCAAEVGNVALQACYYIENLKLQKTHNWHESVKQAILTSYVSRERKNKSAAVTRWCLRSNCNDFRHSSKRYIVSPGVHHTERLGVHHIWTAFPIHNDIHMARYKTESRYVWLHQYHINNRNSLEPLFHQILKNIFSIWTAIPFPIRQTWIIICSIRWERRNAAGFEKERP